MFVVDFLWIFSSNGAFERWQFDLIDMQKYSTRQLDQIIETDTAEVERLRVVIKANPRDPSAVHAMQRRVMLVYETRATRDAAVKNGELSPYSFLLTVKDHHSRFAWLRAILHKTSAAVAGITKEVQSTDYRSTLSVLCLLCL